MYMHMCLDVYLCVFVPAYKNTLYTYVYSVLASVTSCVQSISFGLDVTPSSIYTLMLLTSDVTYLQLSMVGEVDIGMVLACY